MEGKLKDLTGFLNINKPAGITSHQCVNRIRKIIGIKRVGHGGTLDPEVTGVLPIAIGKATRLLNYLPGEKTYHGIIQLGIKTTTDDLEGRIVDRKEWPILSNNCLEQYLEKFRGSIQQTPPQFSSIQIQGKRAYEIARSGEYIELKSRNINIHTLDLLNWNQEKGLLEISIHCSAGTYIRSLARDLGEQIGCHGSLAKLKRTQALGFDLNQSISLPSQIEFSKDFHKFLIPIINAFDHMKRIKLTEKQNEDWMFGRAIPVKVFQLQQAPKGNPISNQKNPSSLILDSIGEVIGIGLIEEDSILKPKIVFNSK